MLFSNIIPISLKVNVDFAKLYYAYLISIDEDIEGTIPRNSPSLFAKSITAVSSGIFSLRGSGISNIYSFNNHLKFILLQASK